VRTVVIGLGNPVRADDAVGLHVARGVRERLSRRAAAGTAPEAPGTRRRCCDVEELWAGGLRLVEAMSGYDRAILVDALSTREVAPGAIRRLPIEALGPCSTVTCAHDTSLPTALQMWREAGVPVPREITVFGIGAADLATLTERLTPSVAAAVSLAVEAVLAELDVEVHP
jgi:hydrogenase maturation protease